MHFKGPFPLSYCYSIQEGKQSIEEELKKSKELRQGSDSAPKFSVKGLLNLFYHLIYKSPPLSAFIDYIVLLFYKARSNSIA